MEVCVLFKTNKQIGNTSLGIAIAYFSSHGYVVSLPLNDTQDYDLVVDDGSSLLKIQVKGTSYRTKYNIFQVALKSMGGSKGRFYKTVKDTKIDYLFVVTADKDLYLIPNSLIKNKYTLNLGDDYQKYLLKTCTSK